MPNATLRAFHFHTLTNAVVVACDAAEAMSRLCQDCGWDEEALDYRQQQYTESRVVTGEGYKDELLEPTATALADIESDLGELRENCDAVTAFAIQAVQQTVGELRRKCEPGTRVSPDPMRHPQKGTT